MPFTHALSSNNFGPAKLIVSANPALGTHTTIATAIASATAGDTIYIRSGTYTESFALTSGVNLCAYECDGFTPNVKIIGSASSPLSATFSGLWIESDGFISLSGSSLVNLTFRDCYLKVTGGNFVTTSNTNTSGRIFFENCKGDLSTTATTFLSKSGTPSNVGYFRNCHFTNSGGSLSTAISLRGITTYENCTLKSCAGATGASGQLSVTTLINCVVDTSAINIACAAQGSFLIINAYNCVFMSGTAASLTGITGVIQNCIVVSSNATPITGTQTSGNISFHGSGSVVSSTIQNRYQNLGKWQATSQPTFLAYQSANAAAATGDATAYTVISDTEIFDVGANYNNGSGVFTAPVTGKYLLGGYVQLSSVGIAHTLGNVQLVLTGRTVNIPGIFNPFNLADLSGIVSWGGMMLVSMTANDTASLRVTISNSTKTVQVNGSGSPQTYFFGQLIA